MPLLSSILGYIRNSKKFTVPEKMSERVACFVLWMLRIADSS